MVLPERSVSLNIDPSTLERFGGAYTMDPLPEGLKVVQSGRDSGHYVISPIEPMPLWRFEELLRRIKLTPISESR
jgi:hypothetical protein